ncbi:MAG: hypothetical protein WCJ95_18080, partial [Mariniphaga sp.]
MNELTDNYDFDEAVHGTSYDQTAFDLPQEDSFLLKGARIFMQLRKKAGQRVVAEFSTTNGLLEITGDYSFIMPEQVINVAPDIYRHDILFVFKNGRRDIP